MVTSKLFTLTLWPSAKWARAPAQKWSLKKAFVNKKTFFWNHISTWGTWRRDGVDISKGGDCSFFGSCRDVRPTRSASPGSLWVQHKKRQIKDKYKDKDTLVRQRWQVSWLTSQFLAFNSTKHLTRRKRKETLASSDNWKIKEPWQVWTPLL